MPDVRPAHGAGRALGLPDGDAVAAEGVAAAHRRGLHQDLAADGALQLRLGELPEVVHQVQEQTPRPLTRGSRQRLARPCLRLRSVGILTIMEIGLQFSNLAF